MVIPLIFLIFLTFVGATETRVLVSPSTPPPTVSMLLALSPHFYQLSAYTPALDASSYSDSIVLDYLYNQTLSSTLQFAVGAHSIYVNMWLRNRHLDVYSAVTQFSGFIAQLNLSEVLLLSDSQEHNLRATAFALDIFPNLYDQRAVVPMHASEDFCCQFVGMRLKPRGVRFLAVFADEVTTANLLWALHIHKMDVEGSVVVLSEEACLYRYANNSTLLDSLLLAVAEEPAEAESLLEFQRLQLLDFLAWTYTTEWQSVTRLLKPPKYILYKVENSRLQPLLSLDSLSYLNTSTQQKVSESGKLLKTPIDISVNYQFVEPNGFIQPLSLPVTRGFQVAVEDVNTRHDLIPDYLIRDNSVGFAGLSFDFNTSRRRVMEGREKVGQVYMSVPVGRSVQGMLSVFEALNITVPVTSSCLGSQLSDKEKYPLFVRTRSKNEHVLNIMCRAVLSFGWKRLAVLYQRDSGDCEEAYALFQKLAAEYHINITNSEHSRALPYSSDVSEAANNSLAEILLSDSQVVLMISFTPYIELQRMYDAGFRGEHAILMLTGLTNNFYTGPQYYKQRVVSKGAFMFFPSLFVGEVGNKVQKQLIRYDNSSYFSNTCLYYDSAMLYFHATDFLLEHGKDFRDPHLIIETMRKTRFQGCSGVVQIDTDSNDRASGEIAISNFHYDARTDTYEIKVVGSYNPYISEPMRIRWDAIQWPNGESSFSDSKPKYRNCNYLAREVTSSRVGKAIGTAICFVLIFLACAVEFYFWKCKPRTKVHMVTQKFYVSQSDVFPLTVIVLDFFVLASVGPSTTRISAALHGVFTLVFEDFLQSESRAFWQRHYCVTAISVWWAALRCFKRCRKSLHLDSLLAINDFVTPAVTRVLFVPFAALMLQVFACSQGRSQEVTDTILDKDCGTACWAQEHTAYAVSTAFVFFVFSMETARCELNSEENSELHIQTNPPVVAVRHILRLVLVATYASLGSHSQDTHAYIHIISTSLYSLFAVLLTETNYPRLNLWSAAVNCAVVLMSLAAFTSQKVAQSTVPMIVYGLFGVYGVMLAGVCTVQWSVPKYESKLLRKKALDIRYLLEFGFTVGNRAQEALKRHFSERSLHSDTRQQFELEI